jgi:transketolase
MKVNISHAEFSETVRKLLLVSIFHAKSGHPGGALSAVDLIVNLFHKEMKYDANNMSARNRDRFILSKGHCAPTLYAVAAIAGIIDSSRLNGLRKLSHELQGHTCRSTTPWVEASTGSLGQGFSFAIGEAKGFKIQEVNNRVYVLLGDGELQEGEVWEGVMFASHHKLDNVCAIIDYNKMQSDNWNENIIKLEPLADKWESFGWHVIEINGHDVNEIESAFTEAKKLKDKPSVIIAHTIKGKGVSYMEGSPNWHGSVKLSEQDLRIALTDLGASENEIEVYINEKSA